MTGGAPGVGGWEQHPLRRFPDFRRLFAGRVVSATGDRLFAIALSWWVISRGTEESKLHLALVMAVTMLPVVLLGPLAGTLVDRADKRRCMLLADVARGGLVAVLAGLLLTGRLTLPVLYLLCFAVASFVPLFESAVSSSLARLTDEGSVAQAVATDASVLQLSSVLGAAAGGVLIAAVTVPGAFLLNAASFGVSFALVLAIRTPLPAARVPGSVLAALGAGLRFVSRQRPLLALMVSFALLNFFGAPLLLLIPMIVQFELHAGVAWIAVFEGCFAAGAAGTALLLSTLGTSRHVYARIFGGLAVIGAGTASLGLTDSRALMCPVLVVVGGCLALVNTTALALFQRVVPAEMKGRFFGLLNTVCFAVIPLAYLANGVLSQLLTVDRLLLLDGGLMLALSFGVLGVPRVDEGGGAEAASREEA